MDAPVPGRQPPLNLVNKGSHGGMQAGHWTRQRCLRPVHRGKPMQGCFRSGTCILVESHNWLASAINIECKSMPLGNSIPRYYHYPSFRKPRRSSIKHALDALGGKHRSLSLVTNASLRRDRFAQRRDCRVQGGLARAGWLGAGRCLGGLGGRPAALLLARGVDLAALVHDLLGVCL